MAGPWPGHGRGLDRHLVAGPLNRTLGPETDLPWKGQEGREQRQPSGARLCPPSGRPVSRALRPATRGTVHAHRPVDVSARVYNVRVLLPSQG